MIPSFDYSHSDAMKLTEWLGQLECFKFEWLLGSKNNV